MAKMDPHNSVERWLILTLPPVAMSLVLYQHLDAVAGSFFSDVIAKCSADWAPANPAASTFNFLNCFIVPFFREVLRTQEGKFIWAHYCCVVAALAGFSAVESSRLRARFPLTWHALFSVVFVFLGFSTTFPLLWLPAYLATGVPSAYQQPGDLRVSWQRVLALWLGNNAIFALSLAALFPWGDVTMDVILKGAIWLSILIPLVWLAVPVSKDADTEADRDAVIYMHSFNAGLTFTCHVALLLYQLSHPELNRAVWSLYSNHAGSSACVYFMLVDMKATWIALLYPILVESGWKVAAAVLIAGVVLGPGAPLCLYYMYRERAIWASMLAAHSKK